ncbi:MAG: O-antigen ligase family protein [Candidatus Gracilibacteria bacterium]
MWKFLQRNGYVLLKWMIYLGPLALLAGLIDYRFHNYFWGALNVLRPIQPIHMFDFWSALDFYYVALVVLYGINALFLRTVGFTKKREWIFLPIILVFAGVAVAAHFFAPVEPQIKTFWWQIAINYFAPIAFFGILITSLRTEKSIQAFKKYLLLTFSIFGMVCLFEYFTDIFPGDNVNFLGSFEWPYIDPFFDLKAESANWLAYLFTPMMLLSAIEFHAQFKADGLKFKIKNIPYILSFIICGTILFLTKSYTGMGIAFALLAYFVFINLPRRKKIIALILLVLLGAVGVATQYKTPKFQILLGHYKIENSLERRLQIYEFNANAITERLVEGIGPGNYQSYFRRHMLEFIGTSIPEAELPPHPHNLLIYFWSELGIFGFLALFFIYLRTLWGIFIEHLRNPYFLILAYPLGHGLLDTPYGLEEISLLFWMIIGLVILETHRQRLS